MNHHPRYSANRQATGFTLIELLVVISIIALLIGILLPALGAARKTAKLAACLSQLKQMGIGTYGYANDYDSVLPHSFYYDASGPVLQHSDFSVMLANYMGVSGSTKAAQVADQNSSIRDVFVCPDALPALGNNTRLMTYAAHPRLFINPLRYESAVASGNNYQRLKPRIRIEDMLRASEVIMVFDATQRAQDNNDVGYGAEATNIDDNQFNSFSLLLRSTARGGDDTIPVETGTNEDVDDPLTVPARQNANIRGRHMDNTVGAFLFGDGHAASVPFSADGTELEQKNICADK
ncbi:MAG: prepilin-type N-terminal cleavage/methylation domain-containing protein [Planctomycetota bacterium]